MSVIEVAKKALVDEANAIMHTASTVGEEFEKAVELIVNSKGRLIFSGIGKSGHIARKLAATFASTGTPAFFVHAAEAAHGDLGMITHDDTVIAISYSGESTELLTIIPTIKREGGKLIAMTGNKQSSLAKYSDVHLDCFVEHEACPLNLAPTNSTTVTLALGDALAIACLEIRGFSKDDFARSHPGGSLGRRLLIRVCDLMHTGGDIPMVSPTASLLDAIKEISHKHLGMTAVVSSNDKVVGIFTEGDLRRTIARLGDIRNYTVEEVMTHKPQTINPEELAVSALKKMSDCHCSQLLVVNNDSIVGAICIHDLIIAKIV